jgi:hypothetical protein
VEEDEMSYIERLKVWSANAEEAWAPDCSGCGLAIVMGPTYHTRHASNCGVGYAPWCWNCFEKYKPQDTDDRTNS